MAPLIHRLWLGPRPMPPEYLDYGRRWQDLNPEWRLVDWTEEVLPPLRNQEVLDDIVRRDAGRQGRERYVQSADVIGYELIWRYGGIYVNCDIEPVRSMRYLLDYYPVGHGAYAPYEDPGQVVNCAIGGPARHPFWDRLIQRLPERYFSMPGEEMNVTTGPRLLTTIRDESGQGDFVSLDVQSFNATHWSHIPFGQDTAGGYDWQSDPRVVGIHHWGHRQHRRSNHVETASQ